MSEKKKKILYVVMGGTSTPECIYAPFISATIAIAMGIESMIYFLIKGVTVVLRKEKLKR